MTILRARALPAAIVDLLHRGDGLIDVQSARAAGVGIDRLLRLVDAGELVRVAAGVYASAQQLAAADDWTGHLLRARAFALSCGDDEAMLTGWSAVGAWALPTIRVPPRLPIVVRRKAPGLGPTVMAFGRVLVAEVPAAHRRRAAAVPVVSQPWAAADVARTAPVVEALMVADAVARAGFDVHGATAQMRHWPGVARARWVAEHADAGAESPLETLGRFTCLQFDLPLPVCNAWVGESEPEYRVDGLWPYHHAAFEADGALKYDNRPDASQIVARQGEREWRLRRMGLDIVRFGWDLAWRDRPELAARFAALLRNSARREGPIRWWKHVPGRGAVDPEPADWPSPGSVGIVLPAGWDR
ncbi:type IV toxin-antitoxin system AbiEi family antitoxin domain-containing protein [Jiangella mangrovi]|uniref:Type IV toxin-antitoxin system AbiEi family antitoxin domain-containing protein n=1 Tax=Jiangella mangrovi TaxID=1524084 RepID=A0A7W9GQU1_9ACTN|nr:type IV toxin-antitoxin system AbiEi family antitoxin domain-containing protein [Jiangella mangrovi]MBB5788343.1 hypothetical protein [Jiangella mangrovi]